MQGSQHSDHFHSDHFHACTTAPGNTKSTAFVITNTICIIRPGKTLICILLLLTKPGWSLKFTENLKCTFHFLKEELFSWTSFYSFFLILAWSMCTYLYLSMYMGSFYTNSSKLKFLNQLEAPQLLFLKIPKFRNSFFVFFVLCMALSLWSCHLVHRLPKILTLMSAIYFSSIWLTSAIICLSFTLHSSLGNNCEIAFKIDWMF